MICDAIAVTNATRLNGCRDVVHMTEPVPINGPYEYFGMQVFDWSAILTVKSELFLYHKGNDLRIIYKKESKSAKQLFHHFHASLANYFCQENDSCYRDIYSSLRKVYEVGPTTITMILIEMITLE